VFLYFLEDNAPTLQIINYTVTRKGLMWIMLAQLDKPAEFFNYRRQRFIHSNVIKIRGRFLNMFKKPDTLIERYVYVHSADDNILIGKALFSKIDTRKNS
jgi:hypothetical protein